MDLIIEIARIFGRIITIIPLVLIITLLMGKRSVGELPVFDFLIIIILGAVVGADIADPNINHIHTAFAIVVLGLFQVFITKWSIRNRRFEKLITFEPTIIIHKGIFLKKNLKKIRYSIHNVLNMLREKDIFDVAEVNLAIIEANGKLTVHRKEEKSYVTNEDLGISKASTSLAYPLIVDGHIHHKVLQKLNKDEQWLLQELKKHDVHNAESVFFASIDDNYKLHISLGQGTNNLYNQPPLIN